MSELVRSIGARFGSSETTNVTINEKRDHSAQNVHSSYSDYRYRGQLRQIAGKHT